MKVSTKKSVGLSPFNCIAMKDIKDKNSGSDFRPLFDCVSSLNECIDKMKSYIDNAAGEADRIMAHVKTLTNIQLELLEICKGNVSRNTEYVPQQEEMPEASVPMQNPQPVEAAKETPEVKSKIKV